MANKKIKINVDLDFTSDRMSLEKVRDQIDNAIKAVEINLDPKSATKFKKDLEELGKYVERHLNKNTGKIDAKNLMNDLSSNSDLKALKELGPELAAVGVHGTKTFNELTTQSNYLNRSLTESNSVLSKMGTTLMNTIRWNISTSAVNAVTGEFQKMYFFAKDLDRSLTNIRIVSGLSADNMTRFAKAANQASKELRVSTIDYAEASLIFYQQGLDAMQVQNMTKAAIIGGNITGESTAEMANLLTSTLNGYKLATEEVMMVTDKLAAVGASTASDFYELSTAMSKVASMANAAGVPIDNLNAQLATIISVTRAAPESVGMSLKTIYGRMLAFKTNTKALMKDEDGDVFGAPKVEEALQAYNRATGAQISLFKVTKDGNKELRELGDVIDEIGQSWDQTSDKSAKFGLTTALAGSRQQNNLVALFDSWEMYRGAVQTSLDAEGTALKQNEIYMESYEGRLKGLQAAKEEMYMVFTDSDSMKGFISGLTKAVEMFTKLSEAAGGFNLVIAGIGVAFSQSVAKKGIDLYGSINKGLRGQNTSADKEELKMTEQLEKIKKVYGAEEANRLRDTLNTKKELLKVSATENDLIAEEHTLTSLIGKTVKENEGATQEGKIQTLMVHNEHLGISADRVRHIQEEYQLLKMAEQELADLRLRAAEGSATDNIDAAIEKAAQQVADLKMDVDHTMALIENRKFDSDKVVEFRESGEENANKELAKQVAQSEKVLQITDMIRTASMTIPVAIKLATDESTSLGGVLGGVAASTAPMLLSGLTKIAPEMIKAATGAASFGAGLKAALAAALPIIGPILAIGAGVATIALVIKAINDSTVTFAKSMKELEKASEELEEQERAYEAIEKQLQEIRNRREEIALINKKDSTTDEEKEKLQEELDLLDIKYGRLEQELTIEDMLLEVAKEKAEFAAKQAAEATMTSDYATTMGEYGQVKDSVTVAEELEYATEAFVEADAQVTKYRETLARLQADEDATARQIKKAQKDYDKATETRDKATDNIEKHSSAIRNIIKDLENEEGTNQELIDSLEEYLSASTDTIAQTLGIGEAFDKAAPEDFTDGIYETVDAMEELAEAYGEAADAVETYGSFLDDLNDGEGLSIENRDKIIQKHQELIPYLDDEAAMRDFLIKKIEEEEEAQRQAYTNMIMYSEDFFNAKIKGNDTLVKTLGEFYTKDLKNATSLADAKRIVEESLVKDLSGLWAEYYNAASSNTLIEADYRRKLDADFGTAEEKVMMKAAIDAIDQQKEVARRFDELAKGFTSGVDLSSNKGSKSSSSASTKDSRQFLESIDAEIRAIKIKNDALLVTEESLKEQLALAKEIEGMEGLNEQYRITGELIKHNTVMLESFKKEQELINARANSLRSANSQYDTTTWFDSNAEQTTTYIDKYNAATKDQQEEMSTLFSQIQSLKKAWMESATEVDGIVDSTKELTLTQDKLIAQQKELVRTEWIKKQNKLYEDQQERLQALESIQEKIVAIIRKRGEEEKKALDDAYNKDMEQLDERHNKRKEVWAEELDLFKKMIQDKINALDEQYEEEDYLEQLNKEREEANRLQSEINVLSLDDSLTAKNKTIELRKQLAEQNEKIAKLQQKKERDSLKKSLEDQLKNYEQDVEDKEKIADESYNNEKKRLEEDYKINKEFLDKKYSDEKVYAEARESIMRGTVETSKGMFEDIYDAFEDFEDKFGKGMGILGDIIKKDVLDQLKLAKEAIEELDYKTSKQRSKYDSDYQLTEEEMGSSSSSSSSSSSNKGITMSSSDFNKYLNYKLIYDMAKNAGNKTSMDSASEGAKAIRKKYKITSDKYSYDDLKNKSYKDVKFKHGGKLTQTGTMIADVHGTQTAPEWIFNDSQLKNILKDTVLNTFKVAIPKIPNVAPQQGITLQIDNFIKADNITKDSIPELKKIQVDAMQDLKNLLIKNGVRPSLI